MKLLITGAIIGLLGIVGLANAARSLNEPEIVRQDLVAEGIVTHKTITEFEGLGGSSIGESETYSISYQFTASNGKPYKDTVSVDWDVYNRVIRGSRLDIQYWGHNPSISAPVDFGYYGSAADYEPPSMTQRLLICGSMTLIGFLLFGWKAGLFERTQKTPMPQRRVI